MKFLIPIPDKKYYLWQILVQITNFRDMGYEEEMHIPVIYFNNKPSAILTKLANSKQLKCHFYLINDDRKDKTYSASMKPYMVYKYFSMFPERGKDVYNYLDSDVVFTQPMDFEPFIHDDIWYGSGTKSYTGVAYIKGKGEKLFYEMCEICGVSPDLIIANDDHCNIGAQYFIKNNTPDLWKEIYEKSIPLYRHLNTTSNIYNPEKPIQKWTAEMWTTIYIALKHGYKLQKSDLMQFHWAKHLNVNWTGKPYFHNAGYFGKKQDGIHFCKLAFYGISPFKKEILVEEKSASYNYVQLIKKTEQLFPELIFE